MKCTRELVVPAGACFEEQLTEDDIRACIVHKEHRLPVLSMLPALQDPVQVIHCPGPGHQAASSCLKCCLHARYIHYYSRRPAWGAFMEGQL